MAIAFFEFIVVAQSYDFDVLTPKGIGINLSIVLLQDRVEEVSPPFEGGVAGTPDYLMFTKLISRPGWLICLSGRVISFI